MSADVDRLFNLLPSVYRQRDAEENGQLKALLRVIAEQVNAVETDIAQLYENWFIETCQDWVVSYIGDLIGYQLVRDAGEPGDVSPQGQQLNKILISRRDVANTISFRRRKGTLALLEQLALAVAGWPAHALEYYKLLGMTQNTNYRHSDRGRTVDIRDNKALEHVGGPFARESHTVDVRRILSQHRRGRYNIPSVGLFVWRLKVYPVTMMPAYCREDVGRNCYTFSVLSNDTQLYNNPQSSAGQKGPVSALNFPGSISLRAFEKHLTDYYGDGKSIQIWTIEAPTPHEPEERREHHEHHEHHEAEETGHHTHAEHFEHHRHHGHDDIELAKQEPSKGTGASEGSTQDKGAGTAAQQSPQPQLVTPDRIVAADLSEWKYRPAPGKVAVDPVLGRIVFPPGHQPREVLVSYHYGFSTDMGGGEYHRPILQPTTFQLFQVGKQADTKQPYTYNTLRDALKDWKANHPDLHHVVIEIIDNGVYTEQLDIALEENECLQIRAADRKRPVIRLVDWQENLPDSLKVTGERGSRFTLDGLIISGRAVQVEGDVTGVHIRHCTLVPGWGLNSACEPHQPSKPSLELFNFGECVTIEHSILGSILVYENEAQEEPVRIAIIDSIVDATNTERDALSEEGEGIAYAVLTITRSTVFGRVCVHALELAENSIFNGIITVARRQHGCMRFCYITPVSRTPRRYGCQPDLVEQAADAKLKKRSASADEKKDYKRREQDRVRPRFNSTRYGKPTYCQLSLHCALEIAHGADDESEMGVFHDLFQPQREANLRARLDDYTPAGMEAGIIYVS